MPSSSVIYGDSLMTIKVGDVDYSTDISSCVIDFEEDDRVQATFAQPYPSRGVVKISSLSSAATGTFWRYVWDNVGTKNVAFAIAPYGNSTASAAEPHCTGFVDLPRYKPSLGGEAGPQGFTFDVEFLTTRGTDIELDSTP